MDYLIEQLRALCGGGDYPRVLEVAEAIGKNDEYLRQIMRRTPLPSGEPRRIGPEIMRALDAKFPNWANLRAASVRAPVEWPLERITPEEFALINRSDWAIAEYEAFKKLRELQLERAARPFDQPEKRQAAGAVSPTFASSPLR